MKQSKDKICDIPPEGWYCSRPQGHEGPCAAWPVSHETAQTFPKYNCNCQNGLLDPVKVYEEQFRQWFEHERSFPPSPEVTDARNAELVRRHATMSEAAPVPEKVKTQFRFIQEEIAPPLTEKEKLTIDECRRIAKHNQPVYDLLAIIDRLTDETQ